MDTDSHTETSPRPHPGTSRAGEAAGDSSPAGTGATVDDDLPPFLTAQEAAAWLRVSVWAVYDAVNAGTLPAVRVGRAIRIPRQAVVVTPSTGAADDPAEA
jgi:excisionase family DNA binding protein